MQSPPLIKRLYRRFFGYSFVGISTYVLDLVFLWIFLNTTPLSDATAIALSFLIGVSSNFFLCYYWVYRGTKRSHLVGYTIFVGVALIGIIFVTLATTQLVTEFSINLYIARTLVAAFVGLINFAINTFFNFKLV